MKIALDLDSTLAATTEVAFALMLGDDNEYSYEDIESWQWGLETFGAERFLNAVWHAWTIRPHDIKPFEIDIHVSTEKLSDHHNVDVVTANPDHWGIVEAKKEWLDRHGVVYDNFERVPESQSKGQYFEYDVFIDDKPSLPERVGNGRTVYLRDHTYNQDAGGEYIRVSSVREAVNDLIPDDETLQYELAD
jgi:5'(3')-deoxyribonucleotidase